LILILKTEKNLSILQCKLSAKIPEIREKLLLYYMELHEWIEWWWRGLKDHPMEPYWPVCKGSTLNCCIVLADPVVWATTHNESHFPHIWLHYMKLTVYEWHPRSEMFSFASLEKTWLFCDEHFFKLNFLSWDFNTS